MKTSRSKSGFTRYNRDGARYYDVPAPDGDAMVPLKSVTSVLKAIGKPALLNWIAKENRDQAIHEAAEMYATLKDTPTMSMSAFVTSLTARIGTERQDQRKLEKAGEIGTSVHKMVEWTLHKEMGHTVGKCPELKGPEAENAFAEWVAWRDSVEFRPVYLEKTVWSHKYKYAGTMDWKAYVCDKLTDGDWKTGKGVYPEARLQISAYRVADQEMGGELSEQAMIVRLPKQPGQGFEVVTLDENDLSECFKVFRAVLYLDAWLSKV